MAKPQYRGQWQRTRLDVLNRDGWQCQIRGPRCTGRANTVDHINPVATHGHTLNPALLRAACVACNCSLGGLLARDRRARKAPPTPPQIGPERDVVLIVGPPGAGKTTTAQRIAAQRRLLHVEREQYPSDNAYTHAVDTLAADPNARLVIVRTCMKPADEAAWQARVSATEVLVVTASDAELTRRIRARNRPQWRAEVAEAKRWNAEREQMSRPLAW